MPQLIATHETKPLALFQINTYGIVVDTSTNEVYDPRPVDVVLAEAGWTTDVDTANVSAAWTQLAGLGAKLIETAPPAQSDRTWRVPARVQIEAALATSHLARRVRAAQSVGAQDIGEMANTWDGTEGRAWAHRVARRNGIELGVLEDTIDDTSDWIDPATPHQYYPMDEEAGAGPCGLCQQDETHTLHTSGVGAVEDTPTEEELVGIATDGDTGPFEFDPESDYFGLRTDDQSTDVNALLARTPDDKWLEWDDGAWVDSYAPVAPLLLIELDQESAYAVATGLNSGNSIITLSMYANAEEYALYLAALDAEDWDFVDRVFDTYAPAARSSDAQKQSRDGVGHFSPPATDPGETPLPAPTSIKARLTAAHQLISDAAARIDQYIDFVGQDRSLEPLTLSSLSAAATSASGAAPTPESSDTAPLYLALVDDVDPQAVLNLLAIVPGPSDNVHAVSAFLRKDGTWAAAPEELTALRSATPPPVVELNASEAQNVLTQIDSYTSAGKQADAPAQADDTAPVTAAAVLELGNLLWGPNGEILAIVAAAGVDTHPGSAEKLRQYWEHGEGAAKIRWGEKNDWYRCVSHLSKFMGERSKGYCSLRHRAVLGVWPGHEGTGSAKH